MLQAKQAPKLYSALTLTGVVRRLLGGETSDTNSGWSSAHAHNALYNNTVEWVCFFFFWTDSDSSSDSKLFIIVVMCTKFQGHFYIETLVVSQVDIQ